MDYSKIDSPESIPSRFVDGWNNRDVDEMMSAFAKDAEFVNVVGLWWHNREQIHRAHDYGLKVIFNDSSLTIQKTSVKLLSETIALVHAKMRLTGQSSKDSVSNPAPRHTIFSFVVQHFNDQWLCVSAHNTDIVPGAETNIISEKGDMKSISYR